MMRGLGRSLVRVYLLVLYTLSNTLPIWMLMAAKTPSTWIGARAVGYVVYSFLIMLWDGLLFKGEIESNNFKWVYSVIVNK
jgi:hypothetical protein